jgi:hypothetical protein
VSGLYYQKWLEAYSVERFVAVFAQIVVTAVTMSDVWQKKNEE